MVTKLKTLARKAISLLPNDVLKHLPLQNVIFFESVPDLSDNTRAVFDEMIRRGMNERYKMIWILRNSVLPSYPKLKNVYYTHKGEKNRFYQLYMHTAKCLICCNDFLPKTRREQTFFYLSHGSPIKSVRSYYYAPDGIDHFLAASAAMAPHCSYEFNVPEDRFFSLGFPRNDILTTACRDLKPLFPEADFDKVIVWYPTFRQHRNGQVTAGGNALPIIHDEINAAALNETAKANRVLLVLKPHFAQDVSYVKDLGLSNIKFIDDSFFVKNDISSYEFVGSCDAMITDYSSIYYDYTLCDKPVALVWEDVAEYKKSPGFSPGIEPYLEGGEKVYDLPQMRDFVCRVAQGEDLLRDIRRTIRDQVNYAADGESTRRVVDYIIEKANL